MHLIWEPAPLPMTHKASGHREVVGAAEEAQDGPSSAHLVPTCIYGLQLLLGWNDVLLRSEVEEWLQSKVKSKER